MPSSAGLPPGVQSQQIGTSRLRTHVLTAGPPDAPPLVLVHGNVSAARFFAETMVALAVGYRCIAPDLRGFGRSERAPVDARRGVRDFTDDIRALLAEGGLRALTAPGTPRRVRGRRHRVPGQRTHSLTASGVIMGLLWLATANP